MAAALFLALLVCVSAVVIIRIACPLPSLQSRSESIAVLPDQEGPIGRFTYPIAQQHPGLSGIYPLLDGKEALAARILLARAAKSSIDAQYYIWHDDLSGRALFFALAEAADRGVRVRLLLDDNTTTGMDSLFAALDGHRNIEVRLFNPFMQRSARILGYVSDFFRLNRRMHNKSFTVDNQATIIGGRNIGDEYFGVSRVLSFVDTDVLAVGSAAQDVSRQFDQYWGSKSSYPASVIFPKGVAGSLNDLALRVRQDSNSELAIRYRAAVEDTKLVDQLERGSLSLEWASVRLFYDDAGKGLGETKAKVLIQDLAASTEPPINSLDVISAYFVPGPAGNAYFSDQARRGIRVRILTNSQQATDVLPVHAGYIKYRRALLAAGVELAELKSMPAITSPKPGMFATATSSLHSKIMIFDRKRIFIGSFNFDPRSAWLNCELGMLIESSTIARDIAERVDRAGPYTYRPRIGSDDQIRWSDSELAAR
jgi:putative cardiolipin synthase